MKLYQVKGNTWVIDDALMIPIYRIDETHCVLFDTGYYWQREGLVSFLEQSHLTPVGIITSHAHRDHSTNNAFLQEKYGIPVAMTLAETGFSTNLMMIQAMNQMPHSHVAKTADLVSMVCHVDRVIQPWETEITFCGTKFSIISTPGHTPGHICIMTPDGVLYLGDALMTGKELTRAKLPYHFVVGGAIESMRKLAGVPCSCYIAAHKGVGTNLEAMAQTNIHSMRKHVQKVLTAFTPGQPVTMDEIVKLVSAELDLHSTTVDRVMLHRRLISRYVEYLIDAGALEQMLYEGMVCYNRILEEAAVTSGEYLKLVPGIFYFTGNCDQFPVK